MAWTPNDFADPERVLDDGNPEEPIEKGWFKLVAKSPNGKTVLLFVSDGVNDTPRQWGIRIVTTNLNGFTVPTRDAYAKKLLTQRVPWDREPDELDRFNWNHCNWARFK